MLGISRPAVTAARRAKAIIPLRHRPYVCRNRKLSYFIERPSPRPLQKIIIVSPLSLIDSSVHELTSILLVTLPLRSFTIPR